MLRKDWLKLVHQHQVIAVVRSSQKHLAYQMAQAVAVGGMQLIEIAWNTDQAPALIQQLRLELPQCTIGTGTILSLDQLHQAIAAGAQFCFTPHIDPVVIQAAIASDIPIIPGALSPTEIVTAWHLGASSVKVFPIQAVGGPAYIQSLQGPLGHIPLIPTGGVGLENANAFLAAGAIAVGLSGNLFPCSAIAAADWSTITQRATDLRNALKTL